MNRETIPISIDHWNKALGLILKKGTDSAACTPTSKLILLQEVIPISKLLLQVY